MSAVLFLLLSLWLGSAVYVASDAEGRTVGDGILADVAPTLLEMLGLEQPAEMTGQSLLR